MIKFNDKLHEDLFDLLIIEAFTFSNVLNFDDESDVEWARTRSFHVAKELIGQQNHPEEYVRYVSAGEIALLRIGGCVFASDEKCLYHEHKIKIVLENE